MPERPSWAAADVDLQRPNAARVYDYYLGGACNFATDREFAEKIAELVPEVGDAARLNRTFLRRVVKFLLTRGIRQFLDIGSGIPTVGNVHEIAQRAAPGSRVVYVDHDPVAVSHSELILRNNDRAGVVQGDLSEPDNVLNSAVVRDLLNFDEPIAVLMIAVLHFVPDELDPHSSVVRYLDAVAPGSYLAISHATPDPDPGRLTRAAELYRANNTPFVVRDRQQIAALLDSTVLVEPGVVYTPQWRPDSPDDVGDNPERSPFYVAVGRKP
ncbi:MAG: hypothetical protein GEU98_26190 [Pseudonocardiaceae bacterium]|nr:hypothetical protein [Pseudonocardiaceae bacterium]